MTLDKWKSKGLFFDIDDNQIFYIDIGEGSTPIVLLHGFSTSSWDWHKVVGQLRKKHRVICFDFLGFGFSDKPINGSYMTKDRADLLLKLMLELRINSIHLVACSFSVSVAQNLLVDINASKLKLDIKSMTLVNGGLFQETNHPSLAQRLLLSPIGKWVSPFMNKNTLSSTLYKIFGKNTKPSQQLLDEYWELMEYKSGKKVLHKAIIYLAERKENAQLWKSAIKNAKIPVCLIWGVDEEDTISGRTTVELYEKLVDSPISFPIENIGHYPQLECPQLFIQHLLTFIKLHP